MEQVHYFGVIRNNPWRVLADDGHQPSGLTDVTAHANGTLIVSYPALVKVGVCLVTADETWAVIPGPSAGLSSTVVRLRNYGGTVVPHTSSLVSSPNGNLWFSLWGWVESV